uniref:Pentraxin 4, long n=1 Tax=Cyprinus carpio carpio TaxID=630221 RepID=A0A8C0XW04_CYPCA
MPLKYGCLYFKRFQQMTFIHLQCIAENYNISNNIDSELRAFKETTDHRLNSLKSWTESLQKKTKRLDSRLANMTRALRENNHLNLRQIQKQRMGLSDLSHKIQKQQSHIESLESFKNQVQYGMRDLQASLKRYQMKLENIQNKRQTTAALAEHHTTEPTVQAEEKPFQLSLQHKIPHIPTPKEEAKSKYLENSICNVGSMLLFLSASTENYVTFQRSFRTGIHELSICTWPQVDAKYLGMIISYATENNDNMLVLCGWNSGILGVMDFVIGDPAYRELSLQNILDGHWHHLCIIWSSTEGRFWYYLDRHLISTGSKFQKGYEIPPGGSMVLGQEQDLTGGDFDEAEAFVGRLAGFVLWTRSLRPEEVSGLASGKGVPRGAVLSLDDVDQMSGSVQHITCQCLEHCM